MPKYSVRVSFRGDGVWLIDAKDEEEAQDLACEKCEWDNPDIDSMEPDNPKLMEDS